MLTRTNPVTILLFMAAPLMFASNMVVARAISGEIPPATMGLLRWGIVVLALGLFALPGLRREAFRGANLAVLGLMVLLGGVLAVAPLYAAAGHTSAGNIALITTITPLLVALIERVVWKVPMNPRLGFGVALAIFGIGLAASGGDVTKLASLHLNPGDALALIATMAWAGYTVTLKHFKVTLAPIAQLWVTGAGAVLCLLPIASAEWAFGRLPHFTTTSLGGMLFLGLVVGVGGYLLYGQVVRRVGAARASMAMYLVPAYALVLGLVMLGEPMGSHHLLALGMILAGVVFGTSSSKRGTASVTLPTTAPVTIPRR